MNYIESWLKWLQLDQYAEEFVKNGVHRGHLPKLTNENLKDLGVSNLADRNKLLEAIARFTEPDDQSDVKPFLRARSESEHETPPLIEQSAKRFKKWQVFAFVPIFLGILIMVLFENALLMLPFFAIGIVFLIAASWANWRHHG